MDPLVKPIIILRRHVPDLVWFGLAMLIVALAAFTMTAAFSRHLTELANGNASILRFTPARNYDLFEHTWQLLQGRISTPDQQYHIQGRTFLMASLETFSDFHVDMEFTSSYQESQDTEAWWGLFFRSDLKGNQYLLRTDFSGRVTLDKYESGMQPFVLAWGEMGSIRSNHRTMEVEAESSWMRVWIDEELVIQYQDPDPLMGGKVGIIGQNAEIIVHNLVLYSQGITE